MHLTEASREIAHYWSFMVRFAGRLATFTAVVLCSACADRLSAPEAEDLVKRIEESLTRGDPNRWLAGVWKGDLRLRALSQTTLRRDGAEIAYQTIVFERVVIPSGHVDASTCAGPRRAAYFWRGENDGAVLFPGGWFDQRLIPALGSCPGERVDPPAPMLAVSTPDQQPWVSDTVEGDISPGVVTGRCSFLEPESERFLREEYGITCEMTRHQVRLAARLSGFAAAGPVSMRLDLEPTEITGVRYTIRCDASTQLCAPVKTPSGR